MVYTSKHLHMHIFRQRQSNLLPSKIYQNIAFTNAKEHLKFSIQSSQSEFFPLVLFSFKHSCCKLQGWCRLLLIFLFFTGSVGKNYQLFWYSVLYNFFVCVCTCVYTQYFCLEIINLTPSSVQKPNQNCESSVIRQILRLLRSTSASRVWLRWPSMSTKGKQTVVGVIISCILHAKLIKSHRKKGIIAY